MRERLLLCIVPGRLYALQKGMEIDRKSPDCRSFLASLMNMLEEVSVLVAKLFCDHSVTLVLRYVTLIHNPSFWLQVQRT